jgi:hypothetical protein
MAYEYGQVVVTVISSPAYSPKSDDVTEDEDQYAERIPSLPVALASICSEHVASLGSVGLLQTPTHISGKYPSFVSSFTAELGCGGTIAS